MSQNLSDELFAGAPGAVDAPAGADPDAGGEAEHDFIVELEWDGARDRKQAAGPAETPIRAGLLKADILAYFDRPAPLLETEASSDEDRSTILTGYRRDGTVVDDIRDGAELRLADFDRFVLAPRPAPGGAACEGTEVGP